MKTIKNYNNAVIAGLTRNPQKGMLKQVQHDVQSSIIICLAGVILTACSDWTKVEPVDFEKSVTDIETIKTDEYYAALREWKNTPGLPQTYVWFDSWAGSSPTGRNSLRGLPDSVTIASNWGGHPKFKLTPDRKADMEYVQRVKGTKVVVTLFSSKTGDDMPYDPIYDDCKSGSSDEAVVRPAIRKYAEAIHDAVVETGYDGYDWDYEPGFGGKPAEDHLWYNKVQRTIFVEELSYWFGKGASDPDRDRDGRKPAKPGLLFLIDGSIGCGHRMDTTWVSYYVDHFILQAYSGNRLQGRVSDVIVDMRDHIRTGKITKEEVVRRTILTENFESFAVTGGGVLNMSRYVHTADGIEQQIGGFGIYRPVFDYAQGKGDYLGSPEWWFLRHGITNLYRVYNERKENSE